MVREEARIDVTELFDAWLRLRHIIVQHGPTIRRVWSKKTRDQKKRLLLSVWPQMPDQHRPDIEYLTRSDYTTDSIVSRDKDALLFPYINLDDLSKPHSFLVFLDSRSRCTPDTFANADLNSIRIGLKIQAITPGFLSGYTMHLTGQTTPGTYGRISSWKGNPDSTYMWMTGIGA